MDFWVYSSVINKFQCKNNTDNSSSNCNKCPLDCNCSGCETTSVLRNYTEICDLVTQVDISDDKVQKKVDSNKLFD
jgi:hypothetical protein